MIYFIVRRSWVPVFFGKVFSHGPFQAQTMGPVVFFPGDEVEPRVLIHERYHVLQWYVSCVVAIALWLIARPPPGWLLLVPFAYLVAYSLAGFYAMARGGNWYHDNPFERAARRHAGEPVQ